MDDALEEGIHTGTIRHSISASADPEYSSTTLIRPVTVQIADDELQPLVGVDFDMALGDSPSNWTKVTDAFNGNYLDLIREDGILSGIGLSIINTGSAAVTGTTPDEVALHSPRLDGIDGARFTEGSLQLTWSGLAPGTDYPVTASDDGARISPTVPLSALSVTVKSMVLRQQMLTGMTLPDQLMTKTA